MKAKKKALDAGKISKVATKKTKRNSQKSQPRAEEMRELFQSDMSEKKQKRSTGKKPKKSFKSKSRYELAHISFPCLSSPVHYLCFLHEFVSNLKWRFEKHNFPNNSQVTRSSKSEGKKK